MEGIPFSMFLFTPFFFNLVIALLLWFVCYTFIIKDIRDFARNYLCFYGHIL